MLPLFAALSAIPENLSGLATVIPRFGAIFVETRFLIVLDLMSDYPVSQDLGRSLRASEISGISITARWTLDVANTVPVASCAFSLLNFCDVNVRREFRELSLVLLKHLSERSVLVTVYETGEVTNLAFELNFTG